MQDTDTTFDKDNHTITSDFYNRLSNMEKYPENKCTYITFLEIKTIQYIYNTNILLR